MTCLPTASPALAGETARRRQLRSLVVYAKMLGLRWNVKVTFCRSVDTAATDGKTIFLPPVTFGSDADIVLLEGLLDHEAGVHCRQTDFSLWDSRMKSAHPLVRNLTNVFEDVWGERELRRLKPGCARAISAALDVLLQRGVFRMPDDSESASGLLVSGLVAGLRSVKLGQTQLAPLFVARWERLEQLVGQALADQIWAAAGKVDGCTSTAMAIDLAEEIFAILKQANSSDEPTTQLDRESADNEDDEDCQQPAGSSHSEAEGQGPSDPDGDPSGASGTQDDGDGADADPGDSARGDSDASDKAASSGQPGASVDSGDSTKSGDRPSTPGDLGGDKGSASQAGQNAPSRQALDDLLQTGDESLGSDLADVLKEALSQSPTAVASAAGSSWSDVPARAESLGESDVEQQVADARPIAVKLGAKLDAALQSMVSSDTSLHRSGRRLQSRRLPGVVARQETRIFRRTEDEIGLNAAVHILTDISGSMGISLGSPDAFGRRIKRIDAATATTRALGDVLDRFDVPFAVSLFGEQLTVQKRYDDIWRKTRDCGASLEGATATDEALTAILPELVVRREDKRVLVLVTDGVPRSSEDAATVLAEAKRQGVDASVVMIGSDPGSTVFLQELVAQSIRCGVAETPDQLAEAVFQAVNLRP